MSELTVAKPKPVADPWTPLSGAVNPIISGFHPDPTICRVGEDYYLANSSFEYFPGAPIFHSRDLVTWMQIGNILDRRSQFRAGTPGPSMGIYGSTLRHHDGQFWFITTNISDFDSGQLIVHADNPAGPWSDPVFVPEAIGIDPDLAWDDDGTCYLTWHVLDFVVGGQGIRQAPIDPATGRFLEPDYPIWQGSGMPAAEGPHLYHIGKTWYLILAEGGTERGHSVTAARGASPRGPFESSPDNPIFTHRSSSHPVQNVGHADLVDTPDGKWAAVYLGARTRGSTPGFHVLGRESFIAGVDWRDGWPVFVEDRYSVPASDSAFYDDFPNAPLNPRWVAPNGEPTNVVTRRPEGGLSFLAADELQAMLCTRVRDLTWQADAVFERAGDMRLWLDPRHWIGLRFDEGRVSVVIQIGDVRHESATTLVRERLVTLRIRSTKPASSPIPIGTAGPDDLVLSVETPAGTNELGRFDGRYFSTEVASGFTGRMIAFGSPSRLGVLRSVEYRPRDE